MTHEDIDRALRIVRRWKNSARQRRKRQAEQDAAHIEKVINALTGRAS